MDAVSYHSSILVAQVFGWCTYYQKFVLLNIYKLSQTNLSSLIVAISFVQFVSQESYIALNMVPRSSPPRPFECFNINCYRKFSTERGLRSHLWRSPSCKEYMLGADRQYTSSHQETTNVSQWHPGYGIESTRLNPTMSPNAPLYSPYDNFDYDAFLAGDADNTDYYDVCVAHNDNEVLAIYDESSDKIYADAADIDESFSSPTITAIMERIKARDRASIIALRHDVEHQCIVDLLKLLEDR